jgi:triacylglycerol lipase
MPQAQNHGRHQAARVCGEPRRPDVKSGHSPIGGARTLVGVIGRAAIVQASEVALMASLAATAPLRLVGADLEPGRGLAPPAKAQTAPAARPVLLVHGFCGTKSSWSMVARTISARGLTVDAITYRPFGTSVEQLADRLVAEVERMLSQTGADKVHLVGHSLGGVVIAQAIADGRLNGLVDTVITLGSPFRGSPWACLLPFGEVVRALRGGSRVLRRLASAPAPDGVRWLAFTATLDMIVPGLRSVPAHAPVETITVGGVGHLGMLLNREVVERIVGALPAYPVVDALPA